MAVFYMFDPQAIKQTWALRGPTQFNCVSLLHAIYTQAGIILPPLPHIAKQDAKRWTSAMLRYLVGITCTVYTLQIGNILMFNVSGASPYLHCGLYLGDDEFIHLIGSNGACIERLRRWRAQLTAIRQLRSCYIKELTCPPQLQQ